MRGGDGGGLGEKGKEQRKPSSSWSLQGTWAHLWRRRSQGNALSCPTCRCSRMKGAKRGGEAAGTPSRCSDRRSHLPTSLHIPTKQEENENVHSRAPAPPRRRRHTCWIKTSCCFFRRSRTPRGRLLRQGARRFSIRCQTELSAQATKMQPKAETGEPHSQWWRTSWCDSWRRKTPEFSMSEVKGEPGHDMVAWRSRLITCRWSGTSPACTVCARQHFLADGWGASPSPRLRITLPDLQEHQFVEHCVRNPLGIWDRSSGANRYSYPFSPLPVPSSSFPPHCKKCPFFFFF